MENIINFFNSVPKGWSNVKTEKKFLQTFPEARETTAIPWGWNEYASMAYEIEGYVVALRLHRGGFMVY
jgi:hypothetical protein